MKFLSLFVITMLFATTIVAADNDNYAPAPPVVDADVPAKGIQNKPIAKAPMLKPKKMKNFSAAPALGNKREWKAAPVAGNK